MEDKKSEVNLLHMRSTISDFDEVEGGGESDPKSQAEVGDKKRGARRAGKAKGGARPERRKRHKDPGDDPNGSSGGEERPQERPRAQRPARSPRPRAEGTGGPEHGPASANYGGYGGGYGGGSGDGYSGYGSGGGYGGGPFRGSVKPPAGATLQSPMMRAEAPGPALTSTEAKLVAAKRMVLRKQDVEPATTGKLFEHRVWEFYMVKAHLSDGMCAACQHTRLLPNLLIPLLWPYRLGVTLTRAAPVQAKICCCGCALKGPMAWLLAALIFCPPALSAILWVPEVKTALLEELQQVPQLAESPDLSYLLLFVVALLLLWWLTLYLWARLLLGVAVKYQISAAQDNETSWVRKTMCCICAMNVRVAVHVDRSLGFEKPVKEDVTLIELSEHVLQRPSQQAAAAVPPQHTMP